MNEKLSEQIQEILDGLHPEGTSYRVISPWLDPSKQLEAELEELKLAANSLLGLIDCLGGRWSLDDAGPDRKQLAELVDYPKFLEEITNV